MITLSLLARCLPLCKSLSPSNLVLFRERWDDVGLSVGGKIKDGWAHALTVPVFLHHFSTWSRPSLNTPPLSPSHHNVNLVPYSSHLAPRQTSENVTGNHTFWMKEKTRKKRKKRGEEEWIDNRYVKFGVCEEHRWSIDLVQKERGGKTITSPSL